MSRAGGHGRSSAFQLSTRALHPARLATALRDRQAGALATFEGWVRIRNAGRKVRQLEYQAFSSMALKQGAAILSDARKKFKILDAHCVHRVGLLKLGDLAVWVGVTAEHRGPAFDACEYIIDEIKQRVPIWKKEFYAAGDSGWVDPTGRQNKHGCGKVEDGSR
ncbi:MAG TPA: molybdenum cofactor biosynthesis protein MoaE [Planctomycetota bacterium]|jgi:molybdopterin synthase catalytic subunit|nr:molybdenum cofactor biosynthesis protein MoaE [Planctomycetota bacterium]